MDKVEINNYEDLFNVLDEIMEKYIDIPLLYGCVMKLKQESEKRTVKRLIIKEARNNMSIRIEKNYRNNEALRASFNRCIILYFSFID